MDEKSHLISKRTVQDMSRPAVFVNKPEKKNNSNKQIKIKDKVPRK